MEITEAGDRTGRKEQAKHFPVFTQDQERFVSPSASVKRPPNRWNIAKSSKGFSPISGGKINLKL